MGKITVTFTPVGLIGPQHTRVKFDFALCVDGFEIKCSDLSPAEISYAKQQAQVEAGKRTKSPENKWEASYHKGGVIICTRQE